MKIFAINSFNRANEAQGTSPKYVGQSMFGLKMAAPLACDTVSFGAKNIINVAKKAVREIKPACNTGVDFVEHAAEKNQDRLRRIATTYIDILESIAKELEAKGVSINRAYCLNNAVKSPKSFASKVARSGSFSVPDQIRATLFVNNPYDLSMLIDSIIPAMKERGYVIAENPTSVIGLTKRGYVPTKKEMIEGEKIMPDLDIRLSDVAEQRVLLGNKYKYAVGGPQKSGYEDIQMRFIREFEDRPSPLQHELIILFGPNYAAAKHLESDYVYTYTREFGELNLMKHLDENNQDSLVVSRYIDLIRKMLNGKISQKLYENAKNKDFYKIADEIPIEISDNDVAMFDNYFAELYRKISSYYSGLRKQNKGNEEVMKQINKEARQDKDSMGRMYAGLKKSVEYFKSGAYKEELADPIKCIESIGAKDANKVQPKTKKKI